MRRRAFAQADWGTKVDNYVMSKSSPDLFFKAIMDERKWEFGGESKRKFDLAQLE
ncbi:RagB/SusD family nutrient uptake outer membrane protein [Flavobacterium sp. MMS24-S5]|uniref:RagB/SusD family nutrient uptake outer membrane protein n=1 Tax=Flavobacterium sp. MMS24-S5 TaxID=3416605 RepID=UPI003D032B19